MTLLVKEAEDLLAGVKTLNEAMDKSKWLSMVTYWQWRTDHLGEEKQRLWNQVRILDAMQEACKTEPLTYRLRHGLVRWAPTSEWGRQLSCASQVLACVENIVFPPLPLKTEPAVEPVSELVPG